MTDYCYFCEEYIQEKKKTTVTIGDTEHYTHSECKGRRVQLSDQQKRMGRELAADIDKGRVDHPTDMVSEWKGLPDNGLVWGEDLIKESEERTFVNPNNIKGTNRVNVDRFEKNRILNALRMLVQGEYNRKHDDPPKLFEIQGDLYVDEDGNHRSLAHKFLNMDKMWAEVRHYRVEEPLVFGEEVKEVNSLWGDEI